MSKLTTFLTTTALASAVVVGSTFIATPASALSLKADTSAKVETKSDKNLLERLFTGEEEYPQRDAFIERAEERLDTLEEKIENLAETIEDNEDMYSESARVDNERRVAELKDMVDDVESRIDRAEDIDASGWIKARTSVQTGLQELEVEYKQVAAVDSEARGSTINRDKFLEQAEERLEKLQDKIDDMEEDTAAREKLESLASRVEERIDDAESLTGKAWQQARQQINTDLNSLRTEIKTSVDVSASVRTY